jgi:hypothetical protein
MPRLPEGAKRPVDEDPTARRNGSGEALRCLGSSGCRVWVGPPGLPAQSPSALGRRVESRLRGNPLLGPASAQPPADIAILPFATFAAKVAPLLPSIGSAVGASAVPGSQRGTQWQVHEAGCVRRSVPRDAGARASESEPVTPVWPATRAAEPGAARASTPPRRRCPCARSNRARGRTPPRRRRHRQRARAPRRGQRTHSLAR